MKYRLQKYEDNTYGYLGIDGNEKYKFNADDISVICTQDDNESREDFIANNNITFSKNQYGSNEKLDRQVNDEDINVRVAVAEQSYGLDKLVNDDAINVIYTIVKQGYGLNKLINHSRYDVRKIVAECGYCLDILIYDKDWRVRRAVAERGYGLDKLINDKEISVSNAAREYLEKDNVSFNE